MPIMATHFQESINFLTMKLSKSQLWHLILPLPHHGCGTHLLVARNVDKVECKKLWLLQLPGNRLECCSFVAKMTGCSTIPQSA